MRKEQKHKNLSFERLPQIFYLFLTLSFFLVHRVKHEDKLKCLKAARDGE